ncbi:MAG: glycine betaine ABC transporter substrate-binding protein [Desulfovermiculus sp.]
MYRVMSKVLVWACVAAFLVAGTAGVAMAKKEVVVGCKNFTEQYIVGQMMKQILEDRGFDVDLKADLTSMALRGGLESGDLEICAEYTGTAWMTHLKNEYTPEMGHMDVYKQVKKADAKNDITWLHPIWNNNTYALACWQDFADTQDLDTLSDFAAYCQEKDGEVSTFVDFEFSTRPDGLPALEEHYDFHISESHLKTGAPGASILGLKNKQAKVGMVFGTDAAIAENNWVVLKDDKSFFPPYDLAPCIRNEVLEDYPEVKDIILELVSSFPGGDKSANPDLVAEAQSVWQELNAKVDNDQMQPREVAHEYLVEHDLIQN